jgi:hypothetical protein
VLDSRFSSRQLSSEMWFHGITDWLMFVEVSE